MSELEIISFFRNGAKLCVCMNRIVKPLNTKPVISLFTENNV